MIKAVGFDIDGTLYPDYKMFIHSLPAAVLHPALAWHFGRIRKEIRTIRPVLNFRHTQAQLMAGRLKIRPERAYALMESFLYQRWAGSFRGITPFRYLSECLAALQDRGLSLAVMSDFPVAQKLEFMRLQEWFSFAFSAEEVNYLKPHPEPFLEMAARFDLPPEEILYVGNNYKYDIMGARGVGMKTAYLCKKVPANCLADITFSSYRQLPSLILELS